MKDAVTVHLVAAVCSKLRYQDGKVKTKTYRPFPCREDVEMD